uniref:Follistatin-related protein 5 n=1 Tax=Romanomermis culicivorax TaxID=13658 RepID=A0A915JWC0_ROMCU
MCIELCRTLRCLPGEKCIFDRGENVARCQCREYCPEEQQLKAQVCAFGNKTYDSLCHLLVDNCLLHRKINIVYTNGSCSTVFDVVTSDTAEIETSTIKAATNMHSKTVNKNDDNEQKNLSSNNGDKSITVSELDYLEDDHQYLKLVPPGCHLKDIIRFGDSNNDDKLDSTEFNQIFGLPIKSRLVEHTSIKVHQVHEGDQYQLYCTLDDRKFFSPLSYNRVMWYRYDVPFVNVVPYNFEVSADNSLYLTPASLMHNGEFRCKTFRNGASFEQKHRVKVKKGVLLSIMKTKPADTGSYACIAINDAGFANASASVVVQNKYESSELYLKKIENEKASHFLMFDDLGIKEFDAHSCKSSKVIFSPMTLALPDSLICGDSKKCEWSIIAKTTSDESIYATLCDKKVLIRINITSSKIEEVLHLDVVPNKLFYVHLYDTLWLESSVGGSKTDPGRMLIQIIKFASKDVKHSLTRYFSITEDYDKSEKFFVPTNGDLLYGYMVIEKDMALHKFDMLTLRVVSRINLSPYNCHPNEIAFVAQVKEHTPHKVA